MRNFMIALGMAVAASYRNLAQRTRRVRAWLRALRGGRWSTPPAALDEPKGVDQSTTRRR